LGETVVLAYSGGLDTSVIAHRLAHEDGYEVVAVLADLGQKEDLERARLRAEAAGVAELVVLDLKEKFVKEFVLKAIAANALYEGKYPLVSALSRPCISEALVEIAKRRGARKIAHGCTGKGNDQVRFEVSVRALFPECEILAPARDRPQSRRQAVLYAEEHGIPVEATPESPYSIDANLWGRTIECGPLEDPWQAPPEDAFALTKSLDECKAMAPSEIVVGFESGIPCSLDGESLDPIAIIDKLNALGGSYGFGRVDMIENRRVGIKSREVYEVPAALALIRAHADLESLVLERDLSRLKARLELRWAEAVYDGMWHSPLRESLDAFFAVGQQRVTGEVRLRFSPGSCTVSGRRSPYALYEPELATYSEDDSFAHQDAAGFVKLYGLSLETWAKQGFRNPGPQNSSDRAPEPSVRTDPAETDAAKTDRADTDRADTDPAKADPAKTDPAEAP